MGREEGWKGWVEGRGEVVTWEYTIARGGTQDGRPEGRGIDGRERVGDVDVLAEARGGDEGGPEPGVMRDESLEDDGGRRLGSGLLDFD